MRQPQEVTITWMPYPENKPKPGFYLVSRARLCENHSVVEPRGYYEGEWGSGGELMDYVAPLNEFPIIAFAELPAGYKED